MSQQGLEDLGPGSPFGSDQPADFKDREHYKSYGRDRHPPFSQYDRHGHQVSTVADDILCFLDEKIVQRDTLAECLDALKHRNMVLEERSDMVLETRNDRLWTDVLEMELVQKNSDIDFFMMTLEKLLWERPCAP